MKVTCSSLVLHLFFALFCPRRNSIPEEKKTETHVQLIANLSAMFPVLLKLHVNKLHVFFWCKIKVLVFGGKHVAIVRNDSYLLVRKGGALFFTVCVDYLTFLIFQVVCMLKLIYK